MLKLKKAEQPTSQQTVNDINSTANINNTTVSNTGSLAVSSSAVSSSAESGSNAANLSSGSVSATDSAALSNSNHSLTGADLSASSIVLFRAKVDAVAISNSDSATSDATGTTDTLPAGFSVTDPAYASDTYAAYLESTNDPLLADDYIYFEVSQNKYHVSIATDRSTASQVIVIVTKQTGDTWTQVSSNTVAAGKSYTDSSSGVTVYNDADSIWLSGSGYTILTNVYGYLDGERVDSKGNAMTWPGDAVLKPSIITQTTEYVDQNGDALPGATNVVMTGLSGQSYTTSPSDAFPGYTVTPSPNATGYMSPFSYTGQSVVETIRSTPIGTLTYTVTDIDKGTMSFVYKRTGYGDVGGNLIYDPKSTYTNPTEGTEKLAANYLAINPFIPQTTTITYTYNADQVPITIKYVDEQGNPINVDSSVPQSVLGSYNGTATIPKDIAVMGYTYDSQFKSTVTDNPTTFAITSLNQADNVVTLHYIANKETVLIKHVDENGTPIDNGTYDKTIGTTFGTTVSLTEVDDNYNIDGYELEPNSPRTYVVNKDGDGNNVVTLSYIQQQTVTVNYVDQNNQPIDNSLLPADTTLKGIDGENITVTSQVLRLYTTFIQSNFLYCRIRQ
ncbi:MucBP domain-containing protein [Secundilactobacillus odoratitofui]|uniref:MucBP domain-containing protein n=1 Tax=Secundilactobacillus odoratitofui TaxID=480930 RepID=UPI0006CF4EA0|nr:MucBP domain-containing protein [Secundilactobacillus odoratitofui]